MNIIFFVLLHFFDNNGDDGKKGREDPITFNFRRRKKEFKKNATWIHLKG